MKINLFCVIYFSIDMLFISLLIYLYDIHYNVFENSANDCVALVLGNNLIISLQLH